MYGVRRSSRGFWLTEVLIALWLLAFVGAGLIGVFVYLAKASKLASERAVAELLADNLLETGIRVGPPDWGLEPGQLGVIQQNHEGHDNNKLSYQIKASPLGDHRLGKLYFLTVTVWWAPIPGVTTNVERGRGMLTRERQFYLEDDDDVP